MTRETAVAWVRKVMDTECADVCLPNVLDRIDRVLGCPSGYVSGLIFRPEGPGPTAAQGVDRAPAHRPPAR